ncbi:MAG TPA: ATP-binding protein [Acidimicrobiia bacterium]|nr:ATP-binding protein [Acidimicrobiia bacterium]
MSTTATEIPPVQHTLRWIVVMFRLLGWVWSVALILVTLHTQPQTSRMVLVGAGVLATVWAGLTVGAGHRDRYLLNPVFATIDGLVAFALIAAGWAAGANDFVSGGYPASWLFVVAYAGSLRWTMGAALLLTVYYAFIHVLMDVPNLYVRTVGSFQYIVFGLLAGWAFDALRDREALRLEAAARLQAEQQTATRHEERALLARRLHDSVLQTLHVIRMGTADMSEIRYLARLQERELRRTIDEYRSPHEHSFRAELLGARDQVEDMCRVEIQSVIRDDAELSRPLEELVAAAREAMMNAAKHSGADLIHLYSEIVDGRARVNVRDRGRGFEDAITDHHGLADSLVHRMQAVGGEVLVESVAGRGTDVTISVRWR